MTIRMRLKRLEQRATVGLAGFERIDVIAKMERHHAYLSGEGPRPPDPPCPPWFDPATWARRMRIGRCLDYRFTGELSEGEYLPDMDDEERCHVDGLLRTLDMVRCDLPDVHSKEASTT